MTPTGKVADAAARRRAAAVAGHQGDETTARTLWADPDPSVRATALGALARSGHLRSPDLEAALADPEPEVRRRGVEVVASLLGQGPAASIDLVPLLADPEPTVVETTAWACGEREPEAEADPRVVAALAALATDAADALVRESAVAALGALGDPAGLPAVLAATTDKATVRRRAVIALAPFDGPEVDAAWSRARTDRDWQVRQAAEDLAGPADDATDDGGR